jgi:hypothetical protein
VSVTNGRDDLWVEVKCQANLEIAGSPRNVLRYGLGPPAPEVASRIGKGACRLPTRTKRRMPGRRARETDGGSQVPSSKGKQPRPPAKVPQSGLSGQGGRGAQTTRRLAQKQPSFKECVIAHWSMVLRHRQSNGAKSGAEAADAAVAAW